MGTRTLTATFGLRIQAEVAQERLRRLGIAADRIRITSASERTSAGRTAQLVVTGIVDGEAGGLTTLLERLNALHLEAQAEEWPGPKNNWMGHHLGRVTSRKVPAGLGDAETGDASRAGHSEA